MIHIRKIAATLLALSLLAGCGASASSVSESTEPVSASSQAQAKKIAYAAPGKYPITKEDITLVVFAPSGSSYDPDENRMTLQLEEDTGINIEWKIASAELFMEKLQLLLATGDRADIIAMGSEHRLTKTEELSLAQQGIIIPLEDLIDEWSVGYESAFETLPDLRDYITAADGHISSLPNVDGTLNTQYPQKMWINYKWLDERKLEMPTTTEELYEVLRAFQEEDATENGAPEDEIPLATCIDGAGVSLDSFLMAPFQLTPENKVYLHSGQPIYAPSQPGYREGLRYLHELYADGLIAPESFTWTQKDLIELNEGGDATKTGVFLGMRPDYAYDLTVYPDNSWRWEDYDSVPPLQHEDGTVISAWEPYSMYHTGAAVITSMCEYPEAAFRLIDHLALEENTLSSLYGPKELGWRDAVAKEYDYDGEDARITVLEDVPANSALGWNMGVVLTPAMAAAHTAPWRPYKPGVPSLVGCEVIIYRASAAHKEAAQPIESVLPELAYTPEEYEELIQLEASLSACTSQALEAFVTGAWDIEEDWTRHLTQLEKAGMGRYLKLIKTAYDRRY